MRDRTYSQYCGLARSLDLVGDRWTLLIVRELLVAPARYRELLDGLPGIATNLLADRLRDLEVHGLVERRLVSGPNATVYALTDFGRGLEEPVEALIRWSTPLMISGLGDDQFRPQWLLVALRALLAGRRCDERVTVGLTVDNTTLVVEVDADGLEVTPNDGQLVDAHIVAEPPVVLGLAAGVLTAHDAIQMATSFEGDALALAVVFSAPA